MSVRWTEETETCFTTSRVCSLPFTGIERVRLQNSYIIALTCSVNTLDHEWAALWDLTFRLYGSRMRRYVSNTQAIFDQHKASFDDLTTKTLGVLDEHSSDLDHVVGDALVRLRSYACALRVWHLRKEDFNDVIREAFQMISLPHLKGRMTSILGKTLAESLHAKIYQLAQPRRVFNTLVRTARTFRAFAAIQIRLGLPPTAFSSPVSTPSSTLQSPTSVKEESKRACIFKNAEATPAEDSIERFLATACQYLPDSEQSLGLKQLRPVERQQAFLLVAALEDGQNPDPSWDAYHIFGYSACQNEHELHILGSVYREIITNCADKQGIFYELSQALLQNKVISFMDRHERTQSRQQIPGLKEFLQTKPNERPSVFRLVQFIRDDGNTDPPPVLSRDYGFSLCKVREEVVALKLIYQEMLFQLSPLQLHDACCKGELRQVAESIGIAIEKKYKRLLANQYPIPSLGYEEISSGTPYEKGLFRWKGKKKSGTNRPTEQ